MAEKTDVDEGAALAPLSFIFGGNTGLTYEELKKRRAIAAALAARQKGFPKNIGEGLTYLGESIGEAGLNWRISQAEKEALKRQQGIVGGAPAESDGSSPIVVARPAERPPVSVAPPPAAAPAARPVRTVPVRPAPVTETAPPPALVDPNAPVTVDGGDPDAPVITPRLEATPDTPAVIEPTAPPPTTDSPPPFFEGRPNSQVSRPYPELAVPNLGGTAAAARLRGNTPGPTPGAPGGFSDRFGATAAPGSMPGEGEPVPYFEDMQEVPQSRLMATPAPVQRSDRLPLPREAPPPDIRNQADLNEMDEAAPSYFGEGLPAPNTPLPRPRPQVEGSFNSIDQQGRYSPETVARWGGGIKGIESGGARDPYASLGAVTRTGDRAYGAYQMMGRNIPGWTEAALGRRMSPQEFLRDQKAQDDTFAHRFGQYVDRYGEEGAARAWYAGERGMKNLAATDQHGRLTVKSYGEDYLRRVGGAQPEGEPTARITVRPQAQNVSQPPQQATMVGGGGERDAIAAALVAQQQMQGDGPREASQAFTDPSGGGQQNPTLAGANLPPEILTGASRPRAASTSTSVAQAGSRPQNPPITAHDISPIPMAQRPAMGAPPVSSEMQRGPAVAPQAPGVDPIANEPVPEAAAPPPLTPPGPPPEPPRRVGPTKAQQYWQAVERDPYASDATKAHAKAVIAREESVRQWQQKQVDEDYTYRRNRNDTERDEYNKRLREAPKEALDQLATRLKIAKDQADLRNQPVVAAKMQADLDKVLQELRGFETVTEGGRTYQRRRSDPNAPFERPPGLPDTPKDMAEHQVRHYGLYTKASIAADQYNRIPNGDKILAEGLRDELAGRVPFLNNSLISAQYRVLRTAASNLITAHLRDTSGAVIGAQELAQHMSDLIPRYGDDALTLRNKAEQRKGITGSLYAVLGETGQQQATKFDTERREARAKEQEKINTEMAGVPNPTPGKIYTNPRTGKRRLLTLDGWEDLN